MNQSRIFEVSMSLGMIVLLTTLAVGCSGNNSGNPPEEVPTEIEHDSDSEGIHDTDSLSECVGVSCLSPFPSECDDSTSLKVFNPVGWCEAGSCQYAYTNPTCDPGACQNGACTEAPCQGVSCTARPATTCADAANLKVHNPIGYCQVLGGAPTCEYTSSQVPCSASCLSGACEGEECLGTVCNLAPARYCQMGDLVVFDVLGQCDAGNCVYQSQTVDCGGAGCVDGHCDGAHACVGITCIIPPAAYCLTQNYLRTIEAPGSCDGGECLYNHKDVLCSGGCEDGRCVDEPCAGVVCILPPASYCRDADTLVGWDGGQGSCLDGTCQYTTHETVCPMGCEVGQCNADACLGVNCELPPADHCDGNELVQYNPSGVCGSNGICNYTEERTTCADECDLAQCTESSTSISISLQASRLQGVAPLAVFFDASETTSTLYSKGFHHLNYSWDFQEAAFEHNVASGPVAARVFETVGIHTVRLIVTDPKGNSESSTVKITVEDPDVVFEATKTICVSGSGDFTGCPTAALQVPSSDFGTTISTHFDTGNRILFRRGETFTSDGGFSSIDDAVGPVVVGAYGDGLNPDARGIFENNPVLETNLEDTFHFSGSDVVLMDLEMRNGGTALSAYATKKTMERLLLLRVKTVDYDLAVHLSHTHLEAAGLEAHDHIFMVDSQTINDGNNGFIGGAERLVLLGNSFMQSDVLPVLIDFALGSVISNNQITSPSKAAQPTLQVGANYDNTTLYGDFSGRIVISDNEFFESPTTTFPFSVTIAPALDSYPTQVRDVIFERNNQTLGAVTSTGAIVHGKDITVRNNLFVGSNSTIFEAVYVDPWFAEFTVSTGIEVYHNTVYSQVASDTLYAVTVARHTGDPVLIHNNILSGPQVTAVALVFGTGPITASHNLVGSSDPFVDAANGDFSLKAGSPAVESGLAVPVLEDFNRNTRDPQAPDMGAFEH